MWLWHDTLLEVPYALRTSGVAFPFVVERLSNTFSFFSFVVERLRAAPCTPN